ncbi:N-acetyltransferase [Streptomyces sp. AJS327]|uniref:GNAT family N-acetyltransferase n=1 Tax=Streptomyces sp. AJS327 TaxID=2545265 RepID=UPI0015DE7437|nr:GNAT family N-acetyltransferase [Streptomyces sp. AJS327]MBA0050256.1 N-acetyltransferase [Streptomyces sp. AJS327]
MLIRPVQDTPGDIAAVRSLILNSFTDPGAPGGAPDAARIARLDQTVRHLIVTDPGGSWIAEADGPALAATPDGGAAGEGQPPGAEPARRVVGAAQALVREGTWGLALLAVVPGAQGDGIGGALLRHAVHHGRGTLRGLICVSTHPAATRVYRRYGFDLHPAMRLQGPLDRARLGSPELPADGGPAVEGNSSHRDLLDSVDRRLRGGAHGPDHELLLRHFRLVVADDLAGSGYCYVREDGDRAMVELLAATSRRVATRVLSSALLRLPEGTEVTVGRLTAEQQWALDVGFAAGLTLAPDGFVGVRGMRAPAPYIPSGAFL